MRSRIIFLLACLAVLAAGQLAAQSGSKTKLKVLFVGYDPSKPAPETSRSYPGMMSKEEFLKEYPVRMPAFKALLSQYFTEVATVDCRDWKAADSEPYDVTIFDFRTKELEPTRWDTTADGERRYISPRYLPDNFSRPVVFIASTASEMGDRIGLKLDWLCLCLDADAHHMNASHPIFKGPVNKVTPTMVIKNTPEGIYHYASGDTVPKQIPMWRVQKDGYMEGKPVRIGLVSRGSRFLEGPDAEVISSGVNQKDVTAVALARHGNFFLWGFGASPADMTEEAKQVFVNAVAYMKQFNGRVPITLKYSQTMATTDRVKEIQHNLSRKVYEDYVQQIKAFNEQSVKSKKDLDEKKAKGIALTSSEEESLQYLGNEQAIPTWEEFSAMMMGRFAQQFNGNVDGFKKYLNDNIDYVYCDPYGHDSYTIDTLVQQIGVSNHSIKLLETCINMLKENKKPDLALAVLKKYTPEKFNSAAEWQQWLNKNRKKLYFTETSGYRFQVNTYN
ncbi:hypothetical protein [Flavihumibacter petaseus]|uniref:Uncharacterized protein n=1 Tax=Flavihumibacter petaseus NBRC 106054 TaxID=1220578 RepID=A0A0E9MZQ8_9BACT|nr:hypothetical protein [Flavihumibacter petaseus]GAO43018.1 hypothetical protein FPE01S_02_01230 [Flavihumibacter petaseus NBRC 106054]